MRSRNIIAFAISVGALAFGPLNGVAVAKMAHYGNCRVTGKWASAPFKPVIPGQLTVETTLPSLGWWNGNSPSTIKSGYEYCMAADIAYRAGLSKLVIKNVAWSGLVAGQTKDFDLALGQISITPKRKKVVDFSVPYYNSTLGVLVRKGEHVTSGNIRSKRIAVQVGTTGALFVENTLKPKRGVREFNSNAALPTALAAHQVAAVITDTSDVLAMQGKSHGRLKVIGRYNTGQHYGALFPKGSPNENVIDGIIISLKKDGTLKHLADTYLADAWGASPNSVPTWTLQH